jgi:hypothetical protein
VFENRMLRKIFGTEVEEAAERGSLEDLNIDKTTLKRMLKTYDDKM